MKELYADQIDLQYVGGMVVDLQEQIEVPLIVSRKDDVRYPLLRN